MVAAEQCRDGRSDEQGSPDESQHGDQPWHQAGPVHQVAQQHGVDAGHEPRPEQEGPVADRDQRPARGDQGGRVRSGCAGEVLAQGHDRQETDHADHDDGGFEHPGGDKAERGRFVLPPDHREQRHGGADAGQRVDQVEEAAPEHARVRTGAGNVAGVVQHRGEQKHSGDRGSEGDQVEQARDERGPSG